MKNLLRKKHVKWHTDNYTSSIIAKSGSSKRELEELAIEILTLRLNITSGLIFHGLPGNLMS